MRTVEKSAPKDIKYFIYARKSTRGEEKQILSVQSQMNAIAQLVRQQGLKVVGKIIERESAHHPGRPQFNSLLRRIELGETNGIISWHPDRLARNSKDGGEVIYLLDTGKLVDIKFCTFWFENTPQGKSMLGHEFVQTKQFSDKLSHDTRRGLIDKAKLGWFPSQAPRGYFNDKATKTIVLDKLLAPIIRRVFELYATGEYSIENIQDYFWEQGVRSLKYHKRQKGGLRLHSEAVHKILRDPFYYGHFCYAGEMYEGKHRPIITKSLYDEVQVVMLGRGRRVPPVKPPKPFTGLLRCGECHMAITSEEQKGHTYYRCTKKNRQRTCSQRYLRQEVLEQELSRLLLQFTLSKEVADTLLAMAEKEEATLTETNRLLLESKQEELTRIKQESHQLITMYRQQDISRDDYLEHNEELLGEKKRIQEAVETLENSDTAWLEPLKAWIQMARTMGKIAIAGSPVEKRQAIRNVFGSNIQLAGQKASGCAVKPWIFLNQFPSSRTLEPLYYHARTHFQSLSALPKPIPAVGNPSEVTLAA